MQKIQGLEYTASDETPTLDGDWIRGILVLGLESKNSFDASTTGPGTVDGPRRRFTQIMHSQEELAKFDGKPAYMLHKAPPRADADLIGTFSSPRASDKGLRCDLLCRKMAGSESYHPQALALRDNVQHRRPFGGFSPRFDFLVSPDDGEVQTVLAVESIDLVPQPASVKSAVEGNSEDEAEDDAKYVTKEDFAAYVTATEGLMTAYKTAHEELLARHGALEETCNAAFAVKQEAQEQVMIRSDPPPTAKDTPKETKSIRDYIRM